MILYSNLSNVKVNNNQYKSTPVLKLTSTKLVGNLSSDNSKSDILKFIENNDLSDMKMSIIYRLFEECKANRFKVSIEREI